MLRPVVLALALLSAALAGCLQPPGEGTDAARLAPLAAGVGGLDDWYTLSTTAGPDASLAAAWWTVPEGAVVETDWAPFGEPLKTTFLEIALLLPEDREDALTEWALLAFHEEDGELRPLGTVLSTPIHWRARGVETGEDTEPAWNEPFYAALGLDAVGVGDAVAFVLAARSEEPVDVTLAFRALPKAPEAEDEAAEDAGEFVAARGDRAPVALAPVGTGQGFQAALYVDFNGMFFLPYGFEAWTDAVKVEGGFRPDLRPVAAGRDQVVSADFTSPDGYATAFGFYHSGGPVVGEWSAEVDLRGAVLSEGGRIVGVEGFGTQWILGMPVFFAQGDGEGASRSSLAIEATTAHANSAEALYFAQVDLGASLAGLLGEEIETGADTFRGILPGGAFTVRGRDLLAVSPEGAVTTLLGVIPSA